MSTEARVAVERGLEPGGRAIYEGSVEVLRGKMVVVVTVPVRGGAGWGALSRRPYHRRAGVIVASGGQKTEADVVRQA